MEILDKVQLNFGNDSLLAMNLCMAFVMFGVALALKKEDFLRVWKMPRGIIAGLLSQLLLLPALTFLLIKIIGPIESVALGMLLVASCPGGNMSNMLTLMAKGDAALSVSLTACCTILAVVMTPANFTFWSTIYLNSQGGIQSINISFLEVLQTVVLILGLPLILGMLVAHKFPQLAHKWQKSIQMISILIFLVFIIGAFASNFDIFLQYIQWVLLIVLAHNALAYTTGYLLSKAFSLSLEQTKAIAIETGVQNSGIALVVIFNFFGGLGGMALIAGWWGVWDMLAGLVMAFFLSRIKKKPSSK